MTNSYIPYGKQIISKDDINSVVEVLKSDFLTQGPKVSEFEVAISSFVSSKYAVAVNSATSALHIACLALGVKQDSLVWTSPITFVASANCARYCGAAIDFVDIDPQTYNLCPKKLEEKLIDASKKNKLPDVVIPVHMAGQSCDMVAIHALSKKYNFKIIEDASHAIGGKYQENYIGKCQYSDITVFSFHPVKIITTAEGGVATTNNLELSTKMKLFSSHMVTREKSLMTNPEEGDWYYQQVGLGLNYRMTELQAALGLSQVRNIDSFVQKRNELANRYNQHFEGSAIGVPYQESNCYSSFHLYIVKVENRKKVFDHMRNKNIGVNVHYIPVHTQPYYQELGFHKGDFPIAEEYYSKALTLPLHPKLSPDEQDYVVQKLREITT